MRPLSTIDVKSLILRRPSLSHPGPGWLQYSNWHFLLESTFIQCIAMLYIDNFRNDLHREICQKCENLSFWEGMV